MTVYVDALHDWGWRLGPSCHLLPENRTPAALEELHQLAAKIGMQRRWFQNKTRWPHYDLTGSKRNAALARGAVPIDAKDWLRLQRRPSAAPVT